jgi:hypothetical protein
LLVFEVIFSGDEKNRRRRRRRKKTKRDINCYQGEICAAYISAYFAHILEFSGLRIFLHISSYFAHIVQFSGKFSQNNRLR